MSKISLFRWFDGKAEEAAGFYASIVKPTPTTTIARPSYGSGQDWRHTWKRF